MDELESKTLEQNGRNFKKEEMQLEDVNDNNNEVRCRYTCVIKT